MPDATARHGPDGASGKWPCRSRRRGRTTGACCPHSSPGCARPGSTPTPNSSATPSGSPDGPAAPRHRGRRAAHAVPSSRAQLPDEGPATPSVRTTDGGARGAGAVPDDDEPAGQGDPAATDRRIALYPVPPADSAPLRDGRREGGGPHGRRRRDATTLTLGVPAAPALPAPLEIQRALRPLQRYRPAVPPLRRTLDETATAELSARAGGLIIPVFRGVSRADALLQFVMDASSSMRVWDRMFGELQQDLRSVGRLPGCPGALSAPWPRRFLRGQPQPRPGAPHR